MSIRTRSAVVVALAAAAAACGERAEVWDASIGNPTPIALESNVSLVDPGGRRVLVLEPKDGQELERTSVQVGKGIIAAAASADQKRLVVLSTGDVPRRKNDDERASLTILEGTRARKLPLESPHTGMAIDPLGRYVAVYAAPGSTALGAFVENPNEIIVIDLQADDAKAIVPRTLRSFGGRPQRVSFSPELQLPGGKRRLLVVETDQDVVLLDLDRIHDTPERPEITVRLTSGATTKALSPAAVVFDDGDPAKNDDARIGVRLANDSNVVTLTLGAAPAASPNDFLPTLNLTDVGGPATDLAFVRTDAGLRLAALVPGKASAVLVEPSTSVTSKVDIPGGFSRISLVTSAVGSAGSDVALLYGSGSAAVAFWALGRAVGQSFRSVEVVNLGSGGGGVIEVLDVPAPQANLKVLQTSGSAFYVLDLVKRTAPPLTTQGQAQVRVSPDGKRLWVFGKNTPSLAQVDLATLHPVQLPLERTIDSVFDVTRPGGRSLVVVDRRGGVGATVLDATAPDTATSRSYYGLLLEGLQ